VPAKKRSHAARGRRSQPRPRPSRTLVEREEVVATTIPATVPPTPAASTSTRSTRSRAARPSAQIVIANYDYLRRDLRTLAVLAPSLVIILIILSFVLH
jgi:hypothetical protein